MADRIRYPGGPGRPPSRQEAEYRRRRAEARKRRKRRILCNRIIFALVCLALLALLVFGIVKAAEHLGQGKPASAASGSAQSLPGSAAGTDAEPDSTVSSAPAEPLPAADPDDWRMILVNNNVALPDGYEVETKTAESANGKQLQAEAAEAYIRMQDAAAAENIELLLCSGYRSVEYQTGLFNEELEKWKGQGYSDEDAYNKAKTVVAVPGYSEHNSGLAADIVTPEHQTLDEEFAETDAFKWLSEHAQEYGFILRYPLDKQAITGIIYEPWHYRYVGPENAAAIKESGLCLEEYLSGAA